MYNVLVVEDDKNILKLMTIRLKKSGFEVLTAENGLEALEIVKKNIADIVVSDIMMPVMDGYEMVEKIRADGNNIPIILETAKDSLEDKKDGFMRGADDYMVKPIEHEELVLRIKALLKRSDIKKERKLTVGSVTLDYESLSVYNDKGTVSLLSKKEFLLLLKLLSYPEKIFTKGELMDEFWGYNNDSYSDTVKTHINRIRNKIAPFKEIDIVTVRGLGYRGVKHV